MHGNEGGWVVRNQRGRLKRLSEDLQQPYGRVEKEGVELGTRPTQRIGGPAGEKDVAGGEGRLPRSGQVEERDRQERARVQEEGQQQQRVVLQL